MSVSTGDVIGSGLTLEQAQAGVTAEQLGPDADDLDVEAYCESLERAWGSDDVRHPDDVRALSEAVLEGRAGRDELGLDWVRVAAARRAGALEWSQDDDNANVRVSDGEETYYARVPSAWGDAEVRGAFVATYEVLPEVAREWGGKAAFLADLRGRLQVRFV